MMTNTTTATETSAELFGRIQAAFAAGKRVWIATYTRCTEFKPKHAAMFRASKREGDTGVYVQSGRREIYALPSNIVIEGEAGRS